ncbi:MAG: hypothetical protein E7369_05210 [Clostridiales bacterium]|nr:hypothetical protein [Clostridiales bacterium]
MKHFEKRGFVPVDYVGLGVFDEDKKCDLFAPTVDYSDYINIYVDSIYGSDDFDGSFEKPKRSLKAVYGLFQSLPKNKGVRVLLKGGCQFFGDFALDYEGTLDKPLVLTSYGEGKGIIVGEDEVVAIHYSNTVVENVEITGATAYRGICCSPKKIGAMTNIVVKGCYVHDVNFFWDSPIPARDTDPDTLELDKVCPDLVPQREGCSRYNRRSHGGIIFINENKAGGCWFENIFILENHVENVARTGIYLANVWGNKPGVGYGNNKFVAFDEVGEFNDAEKGVGYFKSKNIVCSDNKVICAGGDGVILSAFKYGFFERNVCYYANYLGRTGYWNAGLWVFDAEEAWIRYNEAGYTYMRHGGNDAQGFDLDNACIKVVFKHNYAHDNEGGGLLMCNNFTKIPMHDKNGQVVSVEDNKSNYMGRWYDNLVAENLFVCNGNKFDCTRSAFITIAREVDYAFMIDNTVVLSGEIENQSVVNTEDENQYCYNHFYADNDFFALKPCEAKITAKMLIGGYYDNNNARGLGKEFQARYCEGENISQIAKKGRALSFREYLESLNPNSAVERQSRIRDLIAKRK